MSWDMETVLKGLLVAVVICVFVVKEYAFNCLPKSHFLNGFLNNGPDAKSRGGSSGYHGGSGTSGGGYGADSSDFHSGSGDFGGDCGD